MKPSTFCVRLSVLQFLAASATADPAAPYHELRLSTVTSNKMDGVLERFRETVESVRRKHGITTVGCWTASGTTDGHVEPA